VEALRLAPPQSRGLAMGAFTAFLDLSLGITGPFLGLVISLAGLGKVFLASSMVVLCSVVVAAKLIFGRASADPSKGSSIRDVSQWEEPHANAGK